MIEENDPKYLPLNWGTRPNVEARRRAGRILASPATRARQEQAIAAAAAQKVQEEQQQPPVIAIAPASLGTKRPRKPAPDLDSSIAEIANGIFVKTRRRK